MRVQIVSLEVDWSKLDQGNPSGSRAGHWDRTRQVPVLDTSRVPVRSRLIGMHNKQCMMCIPQLQANRAARKRRYQIRDQNRPVTFTHTTRDHQDTDPSGAGSLAKAIAGAGI